MNAEILSVGTELLLGQTINTDAAYIAQELSGIGINLLYTTVVGDNPARLRGALDAAFSRSDLVITTGGLGPTEDDLTKETIAAAAGKKLVVDETAREMIEEYFSTRPWAASENQKKQALLPEGCVPFENHHGTAPGCAFETDGGKIVIMLPGPPSELVPMLKESAIPYLLKLENAIIFSRNIHVFGRGEGAVAQMISDYVNLENPTVATYAKNGEMFIRVTAKAATKEEAEMLCAPIVREIEEIVGDVVYTDRLDSLEELAVSLLAERKMTLATAESCTGGLLAKRLTDIPGASEVFETGVVSYANKTKEKLLGVRSITLERFGAVSSETAREMAEGVRKLAGSNLGIGITGIAGPGGGSPEKPVGLVYIALSDGSNIFVHRMAGGGRRAERTMIRTRAASQALDLVRRYLTGILNEPDDSEAKTGVFPVSEL
ncbi:MAG: competence/damage-inducible protein A [Clostridia bacterium]|nr:competence/damage-inducible protein A [Clostridia bacterium]